MGGPVWKRIVGPRAVNVVNIAGYGRSGPEKSWTVPSLSYANQLPDLKKIYAQSQFSLDIHMKFQCDPVIVS